VASTLNWFAFEWRMKRVVVQCPGQCASLPVPGLLLAAVFDCQSPLLAYPGRSAECTQFSALGFLADNVFTSSFGAEGGWRGCALPRLQQRHSDDTVTPWCSLTGAVPITWLRNESRGRLFAAAMFHARVDVAFTSAASSPVAVTTAGALITLRGDAVVLTVGQRHLASQRKRT